MNNLVIIGHPDKNSFCHNGIFKTITETFSKHENHNLTTIDLYEDKLHRDKMETFFDEVFTPGFAYEFVNITKTYAYPRSFLKKKKIRCYLTHGAPALPVKTMYLNSVKLRLVLGVFTFVFGWGGNWSNTKQFWSVPFVSEKKRQKYLRVVKKDILRDCKK